MAFKGDTRLLFPTEYISAADLKGKDVALTIARVELEDLQIVGTSRKERKAVVVFREMEARHQKDRSRPNKRMVLNKTNMTSIGKMVGSYAAEDWEGRQIVLYPTMCKFGREDVDCVRVRDQAPKRGRKNTPPPEMSDPEDEPGDEGDTF